MFLPQNLAPTGGDLDPAFFVPALYQETENVLGRMPESSLRTMEPMYSYGSDGLAPQVGPQVSPFASAIYYPISEAPSGFSATSLEPNQPLASSYPIVPMYSPSLEHSRTDIPPWLPWSRNNSPGSMYPIGELAQDSRNMSCGYIQTPCDYQHNSTSTSSHPVYELETSSVYLHGDEGNFHNLHSSSIGYTRGIVPASEPFKTCSHCGTTSSPAWRRHPETKAQLCNACGLYVQKQYRPQASSLGNPSPLATAIAMSQANSSRICSHCSTDTTSTWRRGKGGEELCNACGLYLKLNGRDRPLELSGNVMLRRARRQR